MRRSSVIVAAAVFVWAITLSLAPGLQAKVTSKTAVSSTSLSPADSRALLDKYCVTCHNERLKTAGLMLDKVDVNNIPDGAAVWEKVVRKLRSGEMPPFGRPRPDKETSSALVSRLESTLDHQAAVRPNPGRTETIHRLNRAEYHNAIRDLVGLDIDVATLLPTDDMSYGFDNIAGVLKVTPSLLERYMVASRQISRIAVGDPALTPTAETFRLKADLSQNENFNTLPIGTRGGTAINYQFPLDAEYIIKVEPLGGGADPHDLEVAIDGARVRLFTLKPRSGLGVSQGYDSEGEALVLRVPIKAGPHVVGVTFVKKSAALLESVREPFAAPHSEGVPRTEPDVASVTITGPFNGQGASDLPSRRQIFACHPTTRSAEPGCAKQILSTLARRAYRRPVTDAELAVLTKFYETGRAKSGFDSGIELALRRLLVSPEFLFRVESDPAGIATNAPYQVSDLELASRLSFFIWSSIPDDELLELAVKDTLHRPAVLEQQVRRMLSDSRSDALSWNFAGQWLQLRTIEGSPPNEFLFPNFGENLRRDFRRETELFFQSILRENRSALDFLTADYTFVNERLAKHYGFPNVYGSHFRRVTIPDENRRGLLGQGSFLTVTSLADRTTVVGRGRWVLDTILAAPPPPPPPGTPPLKDNEQGKPALTVRERMEKHRASPVCASCHARMDPLGFSLENFDATGQWRTRDGDKPIDASSALPDGTKLDGPADLRKWLLGRSEQVVGAMTEKLLIYALGRGLDYYDAPAVRKIVNEAATDNYRFQALVLGVVKSTPFQMRMSPGRDGSRTLTTVADNR